MKKESFDSNLATTIATQGASNNDVTQQLQAILLRKLAKEQATEEADEDIKRKAREQGAHALAQRRAQELKEQEECSHMKPWGGPAIGGQRDHAGLVHWICLFCSKEWLGGELPKGLRISAEKIGGPQIG